MNALFLKTRRSGFTLIEILAVLFLIAVIGGVAAGTLGLPSRAIRSAAQQLHKDIQATSQSSIRNGKFHRIQFQVVRGEDSAEDEIESGEEVWSYTIQEFEFPKPKPKTNAETEEEKKALEAWEDEQRQINLLPLEQRTNRTRLDRGHFKDVKKFEIPASVRIKHLMTARQMESSEDLQDQDLYFYPSGEADDALLVFVDDGGRVMSLTVNPLSGRTQVTKGEVSAEDWQKERKVE